MGHCFQPRRYRPDGAHVLACWWQHRGGKPVSVLIAKGEEHRHDPLEVRFQPNVLLNVSPGWRDIAHLGVFTRLPKVFFDRVLHQIGLPGGFRLGLNLKPGLPTRGVAHEPHDRPHL